MYQMSIIRIYGIAGHGKGEIDYVGGIAKIYNLYFQAEQMW